MEHRKFNWYIPIIELLPLLIRSQGDAEPVANLVFALNSNSPNQLPDEAKPLLKPLLMTRSKVKPDDDADDES